MPIRSKFKILELKPKGIFFRVLFFTFIIVGLLVFCVFQLNALTRDIYFIQNYEKKINQLSEENKNLEIELLNAKSLQNIKTLIEELNFERVGKILHIKISEDEIVVK